MKEKKIALLLFNYFPFGGLQKDFYLIAKELKKRNFQLKVFTGEWTGSNPENFEVVQLGIKGITNHAKNINFTKKVQKELKNFQPDLVFGFNKMPGLDLYFAADTCFKYKARTKKSIFYRLLGRYKHSVGYEAEVFRDSSNTKILLLNNKQKNEFVEEYSTNVNRMKIIPPGISRDWGSKNKLKIREKLNLSLESKIIAFVGSDFKRKGLDRSIRSLASLGDEYKDTYLLVAGQDNENLYKSLIDREKLTNRVIFLGPLSNISGLMKEADVLIHPAREEAAGNVIIEAMVSSLPILTCESVGFSSLVEEYSSGFVLKERFRQEGLDKLLKLIISQEVNKEIRLKMSELGSNNFFYSRSNFIANYIESNFDE